MAAYRKKYSTNHVLTRLIENRKKELDEKFLVGTVFMLLIVFHATDLLQSQKQLHSSIPISNLGNKT